MKNISQEDYISVIYKHRDTEGLIRSTTIADRMSISNAAVTDMLRKLSRDGLIYYTKYKGISLTGEGEEFAVNLVRRHRLLEMFLYKIVNMPWEKVHEEAERLEHGASEELINRLEEMLEFPDYDPHGDPIPSKTGKIPQARSALRLDYMESGKTAVVVRVNDYDHEFMTYISSVGIIMDTELTVKNHLKFDNSIVLSIHGKELNISHKIASNIFVQEKEGEA
ncbi:MAG: metal-dependent transcriptional regulator [Ignavibacteriaceae bacterium]|nr:metal-dependent transcriptional regulator [Ignavibacteriaceae bacterium]